MNFRIISILLLGILFSSCSKADEIEKLDIYISKNEIEDISKLKDISCSEIYAHYDLLVSTYPEFIFKEELGKDDFLNPIYSYRFCLSKDNSKKITINSGIHGNEKIGVWSVLKFVEELCNNTENNQIINYLSQNIELIVIPIINPTGFELNKRTNHNNINLNRDFASPNWEYIPGENSNKPASQSETRILQNFLKENNDSFFHLDIHNTYVNKQIHILSKGGIEKEIATETARNMNSKMIELYNGRPFDNYFKSYISFNNGSVANYLSGLNIDGTTLEQSRSLPICNGDSDAITAKCAIELLINTIYIALLTKI